MNILLTLSFFITDGKRICQSTKAISTMQQNGQ